MKIVLCMATSLDGKINRENEDQPRFTSRYDREKLFGWRAWADALLVGAETVRHENFPPWIRNQAWVKSRENEGRKPHPDIFIASQSGNLPFDHSYFKNSKQRITILCNKAKPSACPDHIQWQALGASLVANIDVNHLLVEGGARLAHSLIRAQIKHRLVLTIAPTILGGTQNPSLVVGPPLPSSTRYQLEQLHCHQGEIHVEYLYDPGMRS